MFDAVDAELDEIGIDRYALHHTLAEESKDRLSKSIEAGRRLAKRNGERVRPAAQVVAETQIP
jgi:hypothetical protein